MTLKQKTITESFLKIVKESNCKAKNYGRNFIKNQ